MDAQWIIEPGSSMVAVLPHSPVVVLAMALMTVVTGSPIQPASADTANRPP
jgi:hypothetical protein